MTLQSWKLPILIYAAIAPFGRFLGKIGDKFDDPAVAGWRGAALPATNPRATWVPIEAVHIAHSIPAGPVPVARGKAINGVRCLVVRMFEVSKAGE